MKSNRKSFGCSLVLVAVMSLLFISHPATAQQSKVVVIPLTSDDVICTGTLVGTRWCDNGNATVTDMTTGLVWLKYANWGGTKPWRSNVTGDYDDAHTRAGLLRSGVIIFTGGGGFVTLNDGSVEGDWRLPTKTELTALANGIHPIRCSSGSCDIFGFLGVQSNYYWTSTTTASISYAWSVDMNGGETVFTTWKPDFHYVWPVRNSN